MCTAASLGRHAIQKNINFDVTLLLNLNKWDVELRILIDIANTNSTFHEAKMINRSGKVKEFFPTRK